MSTAIHKNAELVSHGSEVLSAMRELCSSLVYAALVTDDGFEVTRIPQVTDGGRFASMVSSMQALGDAVARELRIGTGDYIIIASEQGHVVQLRVPGQSLVLSALFDNDETLGMALSISRQSAERLSAFIAAERQ